MLHAQCSELSEHLFSTEPRPRPPSIFISSRNQAFADGTPTALSNALVPGAVRLTRARRSHELALEALVHELHNAALLTCVVASWANGIAGRSNPAFPQAVEPFLPRDPGIFLTLSRWVRDTDISNEGLASADAFFRTLPAARRNFEAFRMAAREIGFPSAAALNERVIVDSWRSACVAGLAALNDLGEDVQAGISERHLQTGRILFALLTSCRKGMTPCLDERGLPFLPELPQRRRERRFALLENCFVSTALKTFSAYARDISQSGIGLERVGVLEQGCLVKIQLLIGRAFLGRVVWARKGSAGVRFLQPLQPGDPLISG